MTSKQERLKEVYNHLRSYFGIHTQIDFAEAIHVTRPALSSAMNGNEAYLTKNLFQKICAAFPGVFDLDYLLTGNGELLTKKEPETAPIDKQQDALTYAAIQIGKMMAELSHSIASLREFQKNLEEKAASLDHMTKTLNERIAELDKMTAAIARQSAHYSYDMGIAAEPEQKKKHAE